MRESADVVPEPTVPPPDQVLESLLEFTSDFLMIADAAGRPVSYNRAYATVIREALGVEMRPGLQPHTLLSDPEAIALWHDLHRRVLGGEQFSVELAQEFPTGGRRHFSFTFNPILRDGAVVGFCELSRDVTARIKAEEALRESERLLRESQAVARIGSYRLDVASDRWTSSAVLDELFGIAPGAERTTAAWIQLLHPDDREEAVRYLQDDVLGQRRPFDKEYRIVRAADGAERWVHGLGQLELDADGRVVAMLGTIRDVTERRELQDRIRQQEKLEAIGQLAGGVAHDFNNQLVAILGYADLVRGRVADDPELAAFAEGIIVSAQHAGDLTRQLLAFARKGKLQTVRVDLHDVVREVTGVLQHTLAPRVSITQRLWAQRAETLGDPTQLQNAVLNLALNARDAMPEGGTIVLATDAATLDADACARLGAALTPGEYVTVSVSDSGPGIPREHLARIFEPFFTTKGVGQGTGMGLAAVYGAAQSHRGGVVVESEPGRGATFRIYLPLAPPAPAQSGEALPEPETAVGTGRVLVVEDDPGVRRATTAMLEALGFHVTAWASGTEAVVRYRERWREFDVVLLDMVMPGLSGREAFLAMREINPAIRAVIASGYNVEAGADTLKSEGVRALLQKPYRAGDLLAVLRDVLSAS